MFPLGVSGLVSLPGQIIFKKLIIIRKTVMQNKRLAHSEVLLLGVRDCKRLRLETGLSLQGEVGSNSKLDMISLMDQNERALVRLSVLLYPWLDRLHSYFYFKSFKIAWRHVHALLVCIQQTEKAAQLFTLPIKAGIIRHPSVFPVLLHVWFQGFFI